MKVSVCMNTARPDYPMAAYPELHMFEYFMQSLRQQTYKNFEVVICDVIYDKRKDYFEKHPEEFLVIHVPIKPNIWVPRGYVAISATKNTCILYASGEIIIFTDDCSAFPSDYIEKIIKAIKPGLAITTNFAIYYGEQCRAFHNKKEKERDIYVSGAYGNIGVYKEDILKVNGWDELYDGSRGLEDCNFSLRMGNLGLRWYKLSIPVKFQAHYQEYSIQSDVKGPRCCRLMEMLFLNFRKKQIQANIKKLSEKEKQFLLQCHDKKLGDRCPYLGTNCKIWLSLSDKEKERRKKEIELYNHSSLFFLLREQRKNINKTLKNLVILCRK